MIISQTYMIIIFPDYNAPISMHGPDYTQMKVTPTQYILNEQYINELLHVK